MRSSSAATGRRSRYTTPQRVQRTARKLSGEVRYSKSGPTPTGSESRVRQMQQCAASVTSGRVPTGRAGGSAARDRGIASTTGGIVPTHRPAGPRHARTGPPAPGHARPGVAPDPRGGVPVAERGGSPREPFVRAGHVRGELGGRGRDAGDRVDERREGAEELGPFGGAPGHEHRPPEDRRLLLDPTGVAHQEGARRLEGEEVA